MFKWQFFRSVYALIGSSTYYRTSTDSPRASTCNQKCDPNSVGTPNTYQYHHISHTLPHHTSFLCIPRQPNSFLPSYLTCPHHLYSSEIGRSLFNWIKSFLMNMKQIVIIDGSKSQEFDVASGVPQGSVLGPLLFINHMSHIDAQLHSATIRFFTDHKKLNKNKTRKWNQRPQEHLEKKICLGRKK